MESGTQNDEGAGDLRDRQGLAQDPDVGHETESPTKEEQPAASSPGPVVEPPPDGGYGWVCTACVFLVNAHTWGVNSTYGVFLSHYLTYNTFPGATYLEYALVGGLSIACALLVSPVATYTTRVYSTRTTLLIGVFFETLAFIGASFATQIWHLFLSQGVCFGFGMGFLFVATAGIVPQWFSKKRSFANGIGTAGSGLGGMIYSLAAGAMIQSIGLSWAFRVLGIVSFVVNTVCAFLVKDRNKIIGARQLSFDYLLLKRPMFLLMLAWGFFSMLGYVALLFTLPNYATTIGLSAEQASVVGALLNLGQGLGRPLIGIFSDSAGRMNIAAILSFLCGLFCLVIWVFAKSYGVLIFFSLLGGTIAGTLWTTVAPVGAEVLGLKDLPSGLSICWLVLVIPALAAEPIALELQQSTGDIYLHTQIYTGFMYVAAALCLWCARSLKIHELELEEAESMKSRGELTAVQDTDYEGTTHESASQKLSGFLRGLWMWRRV